MGAIAVGSVFGTFTLAQGNLILLGCEANGLEFCALM